MTSTTITQNNRGGFNSLWLPLYAIGSTLLILFCIVIAAPLLTWAIILMAVILTGRYLLTRYYASKKLFTYSFYFVILDLANRFYPLN